MARQYLFDLDYPLKNTRRRVYYDATPRAVGYEQEAIDPGENSRTPTSTDQPDFWPYADQQLITAINEGDTRVRLIATRTNPFVRYEALAIGPDEGTVCDLQISNPQAKGSNFSFAVSTSNGPWSSAVDTDTEESYTAGKALFEGLPDGPHTLYVRDAGGCSKQEAFVIGAAGDGEEDDPDVLPSGAELLRIRDRQVAGEDESYYFEHIAYYWLPSTRATGQLRLSDSAQPQVYSRPTTDIVDRWCVDPGVAPYIEKQVHHDGVGGVDITSVEGATACQIRCTLTLSETHTAADGVATLAVKADAADYRGGKFSLDDFASPGVEGIRGTSDSQWVATFENLPSGRYQVRYQENRPGGCSAVLSVALTSSYGLRYRLIYDDPEGNAQVLTLSERGYTGAVEDICGQGVPATITYPGGSTEHVFTSLVRGSALDLALRVSTEDQFLPTFSGDERLFKVEHYGPDAKLELRTFLLPEQYDAAFLSHLVKPEFNLSATDGLGTLSSIPFTTAAGAVPAGEWTWLRVVLTCLNKLNLDLPLHVRGNLYPVGADRTRSFLEAVAVNVASYQDNGKAWDCGKVLRAVLASPICRLYQQDGAFWLERLADLTTGEMDYFAYSPEGVALSVVRRTLLHTIEPNSALSWRDGNQRQGLRPAVSFVSLTAGVGDLLNLLDRFLPGPTDTTLRGWSGTAPVELLYQSKDAQPWLRLTGAPVGADLAAALYLQTPATASVPVSGNDLGGALTVRMKVKAYGQLLPDPDLGPSGYPEQVAHIGVALRSGLKWLSAFGGVEQDEPIYFPVYFTTNDEVEVVLKGYSNVSLGAGSAPLVLRFTQAVAGDSPAPVTVDVKVIELLWQADTPSLADTYGSEYQFDNKLQVSRRDESEELFHLDTPYARRAGTLIQPGSSLPTNLWQERVGGQALQLGAWWVTYRALWQRRPAQTLSGTLSGTIGPGSLITDPDETRPGVYLLTDYRRNPKDKTISLSAVQLLTITAPSLPESDYLITNEDGTGWLSEANEPLLYEHG